jgi:2-polyprenyl-3-methyl-5-hydroxy-6-metoxy-1,4-benzoquinol methylase
MPIRNLDDSAYSAYYLKVDGNLLVRIFQKFKYSFILPFQRYITPDSHIMDIGCAHGNFLKTLLRLGYTNLFGLDIKEDLYPELRDRITFFTGSILDSSTFPRNGFHAVFMQSVLHHLPIEQLGEVAQNLAALTKPGGILFIYDTNRTSLCGRFFYEWFERLIPHMYHDARNEIKEQVAFSKAWPSFVADLEKNGFRQLKHSSLYFYTAYIGIRKGACI